MPMVPHPYRICKKETNNAGKNVGGHSISNPGGKDASDFTCDMEELVETQVAALILSKHHKLAADLVCYVFQLLGKVSINDDSGTDDLAQCCDRMWRLILPLCTPAELQEMRPWFLHHPKPASYVYVLEKYTQNILADLFPSCPLS